MVFCKSTSVHIPEIKIVVWARIKVWAQEIDKKKVKILLFFFEIVLADLFLPTGAGLQQFLDPTIWLARLVLIVSIRLLFF